jgi:two-component system, NtrC family, response regulator HydG
MNVLVVDDDQGLRFSVRETLAQTGRFEVEEAVDGLAAIEKIRAKRFDLVLLDVDMPRLNGMDTLKLIKEHDPSIIVLIMTAFANIDDAVAAVKEGAYNYISKPVKNDELLKLVERALNAQAMISNIAASAPILTEAGRKIIGNTAEMQKVFNIINRLSKVDTPVLIRGASGTGKELVARAIHFNSARKDEKFVAINCSAIPENLFESELFGHEKGSFTGAHERKIGRFQFAEGGTLFLDELGDMPVMMQVKLLRVLQEKVFTPVGSNREIEANVRVIAATNRPLEQMIAEGKFREDLFYRLNVVPIFLPSLSDRKNDIETLINNFIKKFNKQHGKRIIGMSPEALTTMKKYSWPGNIRELENVIEHAFILENSNVLTLSSLPENLLAATGTLGVLEASQQSQAAIAAPLAPSTNEAASALMLDDEDLDEGADLSDDDEDMESGARLIAGQGGPIAGAATLAGALPTGEAAAAGSLVSINTDMLDFNKHKEAFEREFIIKALKMFKGRINQTALHANIPKKTLLRKIEKYGIVAKDFSDR